MINGQINGQITKVNFDYNTYNGAAITIELILSNGMGVFLSFTDMSNIHNLFKVCGVHSYEDINSRAIRVRIKDGIVKELGHIVKDEWYANTTLKKLN